MTETARFDARWLWWSTLAAFALALVATLGSAETRDAFLNAPIKLELPLSQ